MKNFELIGLSYSPWTEKAKWALSHHGVPYRYTEHLMIFGMPSLWIKTGEYFKGLTVPLMITEKEKLFDSFDIALFAARFAKDNRSASSPLFPEDKAAIAYWNAISERGLDAGRGLLLYRLARNAEALKENLPPPFPQTRLLNWLARIGTAYVKMGFHTGEKNQAEHLNALRNVLTELREGLQGRDYLLGEFSYADVSMATVLQFVEPVQDRFIKLGPATRTCWATPELAREFADLVQWRDALYLKHRITDQT